MTREQAVALMHEILLAHHLLTDLNAMLNNLRECISNVERNMWEVRHVLNDAHSRYLHYVGEFGPDLNGIDDERLKSIDAEWEHALNGLYTLYGSMFWLESALRDTKLPDMFAIPSLSAYEEQKVKESLEEQEAAA